MTASRGILALRTRIRGDALLSFSGVDQFSTCERRYFLERVLRRRSPDTPITVVGRAYHDAIASMLLTRIPRTEEWADLCAEKAVEKHHAVLTEHGVACGSLVPEMQSNLRRLRDEVLVPVGIHCTEQIVRHGRKRSWWVERSFKDWSVGYKGVVDLFSTRCPIVDPSGTVTGGFEARCVWDWKTVTSDRRRSERDARMSAQLALYALAANTRSACFVEIPRNLEKAIKVRVVHYSERDLKCWASWLVSMRDAVMSRGKKRDNFRPADRKNPLCDPQWCPHYLETCYPSESPLTPDPVEGTIPS